LNLKYCAGYTVPTGINGVLPLINFLRRRFPRPSKRAGRTESLGQTLVEYALIIAVMSIVAVGVLISLGQQTKSIYTAITSQISRAGS
jgi:Flp pilus assembly pilin Flp